MWCEKCRACQRQPEDIDSCHAICRYTGVTVFLYRGYWGDAGGLCPQTLPLNTATKGCRVSAADVAAILWQVASRGELEALLHWYEREYGKWTRMRLLQIMRRHPVEPGAFLSPARSIRAEMVRTAGGPEMAPT